MPLVEQVGVLLRTEYFDADFYARQVGKTFDSPSEAAHDYLERGFRRGFNPSAKFHTRFYLERYGDVADAGINPLMHFLDYGNREGRKPRLSNAPIADLPVAPDDAVWETLARDIRDGANDPAALVDTPDTVDIVIPVYRGYDDTLACIYTVLKARNHTPFRLIVINDDGPDPRLTAKLEELHARGLILLLTNIVNLGFVGTVNRGMRESRLRDVILLNSDTEVFGDWIDRLRAQAYATPRVATVTPFSNNATIFSYPFFNESNTQQLEIEPAELDQITKVANRGESAIVPTGVGFCFYIRRAALDEIGFFDTDLFGKGYGEENDFCMRAIEHAWDNLAALDIFVRHTGEVSFGAGASAGKRQGGLRLMAVHPRYDAVVQECIRRDPFKTARGRIDIERFARRSDGRGILMIEHGWGGGIERNIADLTTMFAQADVPVLVCVPAEKGPGRMLKNRTSDDYPNLPPFQWRKVDEAAAQLRALNLGHVHIHSLIGMEQDEILAILSAVEQAGLRYSFTVHDYAPICPRITMIDWGGSYCESPSATYCTICIGRAGTPFGQVDIDVWRHQYDAVLARAHRLIVPDADVVERLLCRVVDRTLLEPKILVRPHPVDARIERIAQPLRADVRTVGIIGAIGPHKGSATLMALCADAMSRNLPLRFVVYGYTNIDELASYPNLEITGAYKEADFRDMVNANPCDLALFLSVWPETFSYTLDYALHNGIYPVSLDIGAPARRIRESGFGTTIPFSAIFDPGSINDFLVDLPLGPETREGVIEPGRQFSTFTEYYDLG